MAGFLLVTLWSGSTLGGYYVDDFEVGYIEGTNVQSLVQQGWTASDVGPAVRTWGPANKAVDIPQGSSVSNSAGGVSKVWVDLLLNETNQVDLGSLVNPNTNHIWMAGVLTNGCLVYYNRSLAGGVGAWDVCTNDVRGTTIVSGQVATGSWGRVTVFQDFSTHTVALFLNGRLLREQVPFMSAAINSMSGFQAGVGTDHAGLDNVAVTNAIPTGLTDDLDGDGRQDADEIATYGRLSTWGPSTLTASVTNGVGGAVLPASVDSILWQGTTNFTFNAGDGYFVDRVWTNGGLAADYSGLLLKTAGFTWSNVVASGTLAVGFLFDGVQYVPGEYATVTGALAAAFPNDRIVVSNGIYAGSIAVSNGVSIVGTNMTGLAADTNLTIRGAMTVVTGLVNTASGAFMVTGQVSIAAGGVLTISNTVANFGGLTIGEGGLLHMVNGVLIVGSYTNSGTFTLSLVTNEVSSAGNGTISPSGTSTMISGWSNVVYTLQVTNIGYVVGSVTNNGAVTSFTAAKTAIYTNFAANITNNQTITAAFVYNGIRYLPGDYTTVTGALAEAVAGDHVVVSNGIYSESITVSNGVSLIGTNLTGTVGNTNLTINGAMTVVTGLVSTASGAFTVTGEVTVVAGGVLTISNTVAHFGGLAIEEGGLLHIVNGTLIVGSYTNSGSFTLSLVTNVVTSAGNGTISPFGTSTMISGWSNVVYSLQATNIGYVVGSVTNNGVVTPFAETKTATYTDPAASITNNRTITAAFVYNGIRYVPGDYETITAALAAALAGDRIMVTNGTYTESVVVSNGIALTVTNSTVTFNSLTIQGLGSVVHVVNSTVTVNGTTYTSTFDMNSTWGEVMAAMPLNFFDGFEAYAPGSLVSALSGFGWWASSSSVAVEIPATKAPGSINDILLPAGQAVSNLVSGSGLNKVWTDLYLMETQAMSSVDVAVTNDGPAVIMYLGTNGWLTVFNRDAGGWDVCSNDIYGAAAPRATGSWIRVSWFQDFSDSGTAAFLVDGHVVRQQVPFVGHVTQYNGLRMVSGCEGEARLDSVSITTNLPSGLSYDGNGNSIADALEVQQNGFVLPLPRGSVFKVR
jgi:hypothetical protein